jgi:probable phosphoglycerate mutase
VSERRRIYLARHGAVSYVGDAANPSLEDPPLTEEGVAQAEALGRTLEGHPIDLAVYTGMERTRQTAQIATAPRDLELTLIEGFREAKTGTFEEIETEEEMRETIVGAFHDAHEEGARFLTGETYAELWQRVEAAWSELLARDWEHAFVAAHGVVNRTILAQALGAGPHIYRRLEQDTGCLNVLDIEGRGADARVAYVRLVNFTPYNMTKAGMKETTLEMLWRQFAG